MKEQSVIHNTFVIERSYPETPQNLFSPLSPRPGEETPLVCRK